MVKKAINIPSQAQALKQVNEQIKPYKKIAESMEEQFASQLIKQMRKSVPKEKEPSSAETYYNSLLDAEYAGKIAQGDKGLGIKKVVMDQILPQYLKNRKEQLESHRNSRPTVSKELRNEQ